MIKKDPYFELQHDRTLRILFLTLFGAVIAGLFFIFRYYFWPFLFAILFYMALQPVYDFFERLIKRKGLSSLLMILLLVFLVLIPLFFIIMELISQMYELYSIIHGEIKAGVIDDFYKSRYAEFIFQYIKIKPSELASRITDFIQRMSGVLFASFQTVVSYPVRFLINFFFMILMLFFLFKDGNKFRTLFYNIMPFPQDLEEKVINRLKEVIRVLLTGNIIIMVLQGLMVGLGLFFVELHLAFLGGSLAGILSLIPVIGTTLVWAPAVIYLVFSGSYLSALFLGIWCLVWYLVLENLVKPKVFGRRLNFHPVIFFFLLLGSIQAFGLPGVFIGPLLLALYYSLWEIYKVLQEYDLQQDVAVVKTKKPRKK